MQNFLMIPRQLFDDYLAGKLTGEELLIFLYLFYKANITSGVASVNYGSISNDLEDIFDRYKDPVNQINKVMLSLKKQRRIYYTKHPGSRGKFEVYIDKYPCKREGKGKEAIYYLDISSKFQENPAELLVSQQRLEELKNSKDKLINSMSMNESSRGAYTYNKDIYKDNTDINKYSFKKYGESRRK